MKLVFVSDALGTFTAGIITGAWRICLVGFLMGLEVPAIAWLEESMLLLILLLALAIIAMVCFICITRAKSKGYRGHLLPENVVLSCPSFVRRR
jgi:hypothetical protein